MIDNDGIVVGITSLAMNISERQHAEDALRVSEARFRRLAEQLSDYIIIHDLTVDRAVYFNRETFLHMPDMDGIETTRQIMTELPVNRQPYVIAMTAAAMQEDRDRCEAVGMHDFISKPVNVDELIAALFRAAGWLEARVNP